MPVNGMLTDERISEIWHGADCANANDGSWHYRLVTLRLIAQAAADAMLEYLAGTPGEEMVLTNKEIARALEKQKIFKGANLEDAIDEGDRLIAKAQLAKVAPIYHARQEQAVAKAVKTERERIFKEVELSSHKQATNMHGISLSRGDWQALKQGQ